MKQTFKWELQEQKSKSKTAIFSEHGIEDIALITMIKDEEDIIYENLIWHFCIGFRKFVIVDNDSTDNTRMLVNKFKNETKEKAQVIIIDDPIVEHIQSAFITSSMQLAHHIWPTVKWMFPVDADEFWYPPRQLDNILYSIPKDKNTILTLQYDYVPTEKGEEFNDKIAFYKNIRFRRKFNIEQQNHPDLGKIATRPALDITIAQGNHSTRKKGYDYNYDSYVSGNMIGLDMLHFQRRSISQVRKKFTNGSRANILGQQKGVISMSDGGGWTAFAAEVEKKGAEQAAKDRFNEWVVDKNKCIEAPLPMDQAFALFHKIIEHK